MHARSRRFARAEDNSGRTRDWQWLTLAIFALPCVGCEEERHVGNQTGRPGQA